MMRPRPNGKPSGQNMHLVCHVRSDGFEMRDGTVDAGLPLTFDILLPALRKKVVGSS